MKIAAIVCNVILIGFTILVSLTDGLATEAPYIVFGLLLVLIPIANLVVIARRGPKIAAIIGNVLLLGFACWAMIDQYPHPKEAGFVEYAVLVILTPILSAI